MPRKNKTAKKKAVKREKKVIELPPNEAVKFQKECAKCGVNLDKTGYVENNYKRFCGPACAA